MDRTETLKIMAVLRGAYPNFYRNMSDQDVENAVGLWNDMFRSDEYVLVAAAVKSLLETDEKGYPPHIGSVKAKMRLLTEREEPTEAEVWNLVSKALRNGLYGSKEEFDKLPPAAQRVVGSPEQLRSWAMMDSETVQSVVASNFQRAYRTIVQREREIARLPADVRALLEQVSAPLALEEGETG